MTIRCAGCGKTYRMDPARLAGRERVRVQCPSCRAVFEVGGGATGSAAPPPASTGAGPTQVYERPGGSAAPAPVAPAPGETTRSSKRSAVLSEDGEARYGTLALPAHKKASLAILSGPEQGRIVELTRPRMVIGRADADIVLADPEASRQHAVVEAYGDVFVIRDLDSTNGTFVAEQKIAAQEIHNQDEFRVGSSRVMLILTALEG